MQHGPHQNPLKIQVQNKKQILQKKKQRQKKQQKQQKEEQLQQQLKQHQPNENSLRVQKQQKETELEEQRLAIRQLIDQQWKIEEKVAKNYEEIVHEFQEQSLKKLRESQQKEKEFKRMLEKKRLFLEQQKATKNN